MNEIQVLQNIIKDYDTNLKFIENELQILLKSRTTYRNNRSIILELIEKKTNQEIDKDLFSEFDDDLSEYDNNE